MEGQKSKPKKVQISVPEKQDDYFDKLLYYLNNIFQTNLVSQELFLDLHKQKKKMKFKYIKSIYTTLTEGKAHQVIYQKDRSQLLAFPTSNFNYLNRTCWRVIEKLFTKIAYYMVNQANLSILAPHMLKVLGFSQNAFNRLGPKGNFRQFMLEVIDHIVEENNLLEKKIYDRLIKMGYIYSIDQFYRMNRFEGPNLDFLYSNEIETESKKIRDNDYDSEQEETKTVIRRFQRSRKVLRTLDQSQFCSIFDGQKSVCDKSQVNKTQAEENMGEQLSQSSDEMKAQTFNRISYQIRQKLEKTMEQVNNYSSYSVAGERDDEDYFTQFLNEPNHLVQNSKGRKEPVIKEIMKNLKLKKFKANQKLIVISKNWSQNNSQTFSRKNSTKKVIKDRMKTNRVQVKNRTSIVTALSKRMRQKIFQNEQVSEFEDLMIQNLGKIQKSIRSEKIFGKQKLKLNRKSMLMKNYQKKIDVNKNHFTPNFPNFHFFNKSKSSKQNTETSKMLMDKVTHEHESESEESRSLQQIDHIVEEDYPQNKPKKLQKRISRFAEFKKVEKTPLSPLSPLSSLAKPKLHKRNRAINTFANQQFNSTILTLAAKKYNKYSTEGSELIELLNLPAFSINNLRSDKYLIGKAESKRRMTKELNKMNYLHERRFQIYDRFHRRMI